jgi:hypothetical protein
MAWDFQKFSTLKRLFLSKHSEDLSSTCLGSKIRTKHNSCSIIFRSITAAAVRKQLILSLNFESIESTRALEEWESKLLVSNSIFAVQKRWNYEIRRRCVSKTVFICKKREERVKHALNGVNR